MDTLPKKLPYVAWAGDLEEGASLIFASSAAEAKRLAWDHIFFNEDHGWLQLHVKRLCEFPEWLEHLRSVAGSDVIEYPECCPVCDRWGCPIHADGSGCEECQ